MIARRHLLGRLFGVFAALVIVAAEAAADAADYTALAADYSAPAPFSVLRAIPLDRALEDRILALDPANVSDSDVRNLLARGPAPRIINIHGGVPFVYLVMSSFSKFLIGMGYPEERIRLPATGEFSLGPYGESTQEAGSVAAFYEREGLTPMLIGHSQGGIQVVKILYELAGGLSKDIPLWNPYADRGPGRATFVDPRTGENRTVVGLRIGFASAVAAGGSAMLLAHHWQMAGKLKVIPDSVEDFTGFSLGFDWIALDGPDGEAGRYRSGGTAQVRNVILPSSYSHLNAPATSHLAESENLRQWINDFRPDVVRPVPTQGDTKNIWYAAEMWYSIKRHWVLEMQALIRARRAANAYP